MSWLQPWAFGYILQLRLGYPLVEVDWLNDLINGGRSFPKNFRTNNPGFFAGTGWIELDDLKAWLGNRDDLMHLLEEPSVIDMSPFLPDLPSAILQPQPFYGHHSLFDPGFNPNGDTIDFHHSGISTPSSGYSWNPYEELAYSSSTGSFCGSEFDHYSATNSSSAGSELDYYSTRNSSTPASDHNLFDDNVSAAVFPEIPDWDPSLASCFAQHPFETLPMAFPTDLIVLDMNFSQLNDVHSPTCSSLPNPDSEAWDWQPSDTVWLDKDVSSEVYIPAEPFTVTINCKVVRIERLRGVPSEYPVPCVATAYIVDFRAVLDSHRVKDGNVMTLDMIWKDKDCHSWDGTPGERQIKRAPPVNVQLFASLGKFEEIRCRRARQSCKGVFTCDIIDPSLLLVQRYELDPHAHDAVNNAQIIQRLNQGTVIRNKVICYVNMIKKMKCTGKDPTGGACGGYQVLKKAAKVLASGHMAKSLWHTYPSRRRRRFMSFPHLKNDEVHTATMEQHDCDASTTIYVPLAEEAIRIAIVVPKHLHPHTHPPPPPTRVPTAVKWLYEQTICAYGTSMATVNKIKQAASTLQIMGVAPGLVHPSLLNVSTKQGIITTLKKREPGGDKSGWEGLFDLYKSDQEKEPRERYIHSFDFLPGRSPASVVITMFEVVLLECVEWVRSLNQDTTFKRMKAGLLNEYELTAFFAPLNRLFTFGRIYMDGKDSDAFEFAWDRIHDAFLAATGKKLSFKAWDPKGWLVTVSGDMEAAPWIGMARSFIKRMDSADRPTVDEFLAKVLRICRRHALEGLRHAIRPHVDDEQWERFTGFLVTKTREELQIFSDWVFSLNIKEITTWWKHKLNHKWILPGLLECLSGLSHEDWLTTPFTSNGNETQHHWTNLQTGIGLNARECILRAAKADHAVGEQFEASLKSGVMASNRNELSHRTDRNAKRQTSILEKACRTHTTNQKIKDMKAELAALVAEAKTNLSGVVRVTQKSKAHSLGACRKGKAFGRSTTAGPLKQGKKKTGDEIELDGLDIDVPEVFPDHLHDDDEMAKPGEGASEHEEEVAMSGDPTQTNLDCASPEFVPPVADPPTHSNLPGAPSSARRSSRKRTASSVHEDAPANKTRNTDAFDAAGPSIAHKQPQKRKPKPWSVRHMDDRMYTSFQFLAKFPAEYRELAQHLPPKRPPVLALPILALGQPKVPSLVPYAQSPELDGVPSGPFFYAVHGGGLTHGTIGPAMTQYHEALKANPLASLITTLDSLVAMFFSQGHNQEHAQILAVLQRADEVEAASGSNELWESLEPIGEETWETACTKAEG
ncbi:hypothetical protein C8J57DRAFT_1534356 [Mycena rebaudengoi]|nr:hypothetical protein C8J57DRAFT_1534356 [Mycena rebaudengoi]